MADFFKVVVEQALDGNTVENGGSRLTYEVYGMSNAEANAMNIGITEAALQVVKAVAAQKAAANPTG